MSTTVGLRERKKAATRQSLYEAAVRLAVEHGLENVTVEAIADAAGVSRRTFSNYFAGKDDALLYGEELWLRALLAAFTDRPAGESSRTALRHAFHALHAERGEPEPGRAARLRLVKQHPSLLARQMARYADFERELAELISARDGRPEVDVRARVQAASFLTGLRVAAHLWIEQQGARSLRSVMDEVLDHLA
ncbi:TetR family transcriptional regulator [Actinomadura craniellae]|uniref:TetR family transcriptional regulator n=1 Tax=Actinomadura craniellae TaxID=2231787 RepID=A0A365H9B4_9ACTN|nr:TetR family transcriptional regulator [Actinomadura craniellae]RAY15619.1 TetR family transcriptional regulator [Actinomadura craniellae]